VTKTVINIFDLAVIIQVKDLTRIGPHPEVKASYSKRATFRSDRSMRREHVSRHPSTAGEIVPLGYFLDNAVSSLLPGEAIWAGWCFLADERCVEVDCNFLTDEMHGRIIHIHGTIFL
jgi:hypothetical protein